MEIEKKYRITALPEGLENCRKKIIEQGYLCSKPTVRIRRSNDDYILTYKMKKNNPIEGDASIVNEEIEMELTKAGYQHLMEKIDNKPVYKTRYLIPLDGGLTAELDIFSGHLEGLRFVEVEFPSVEAAAAFKAPSWFGKEVSDDRRYRNTYLSSIDAPEEDMLP